MEKERPLTLSQLANYANEVLLPAIDLGVDKKIKKLRKELLDKDDKILAKLNIL